MSEDVGVAALEIVSAWEWDCWDFDSCEQVPRWLPVNEAINRLAMDGIFNPPAVILRLLANGQLLARGAFRWKGYRRFGGGVFERDARGDISASWWKKLRTAELAWDFETALVDMPELGLQQADSSDWDWRNCAFSVAVVSGEHSDVRSSYSEEWLSAWDVELRLAPPGNDNCEQTSREQICPDRNKGGAPAKYDWERAVAAVVFQWADEGSWQPAFQADVKKRLADWFAQRGEYPSDSLLKERARWLIEEFRQRGDEANNLAA